MGQKLRFTTPVPQYRPNFLNNRIRFLQYLIVPESQNSETSLIQAPITDHILFAFLMLSTVDFHHQPVFQAHEVKDIVQEWMLPTKFEPLDLPAAQTSP